MSSLRLALKQSLQETGHLVPKEKKKRTSKKQDKKKPREDGRPRKRGRPPKRRPRPEEEEEEEVSTPAAAEIAEAVTAKVDKRPFVDDQEEEEEEEEFSSENEFSYDSEEEEEDSEEDSEEDDHEEDEEEGVVAQRQDKKVDVDHKRDHHHRHGEEKETSKSHTIQDTNESSSSKHHKESSHRDDPGDSEEERRRQRKLLKKKLKNSAANKIQSQWKKRQNRNSPNPESSSSKSKTESTETKTSTHNTSTTTSSSSHHHHKNEKETDSGEKGKHKPESNAEPEPAHNPVVLEKKKRKPGTVPAPSHDILEWSQRLTEKKARKHISKGMRVKVRFATKVRREGKIVKKRKWYGGRVSNVTPDGSKIKIKYDDGTSEISQFPDDDVVVDATHNGQHSQTASAVVHRFLPPQARTPTPTPPVVAAAVEEEKPEKKPEAAVVEKKPEEEKETPKEKEPAKVVESSTDEKEKEPETKPAPTPKENKPEEGEVTPEKKEEKVEEPKPKKDEDKEDVEMGEVPETKSPTPPVLEETKPTTVETAKSEDGEVEEEPKASTETVDDATKKKSEEETEAKPMDTDEPAPPKDDKPAEVSNEKTDAAPESTKEEGEEEEEEEKEAPKSSPPPPKEPEAPTATTKASKPTLTIRISKAKVQEKLQEKPPETPKHTTAYSSDEGELDADTPVTARKVKSLKVKRKRISEDSPSASRPKKRKAEVAAASDAQDTKSEDAATTEHEKKSKKSKVITIPLKKIEQPTEVPELPSLGAIGKSKKKDKERANSPVPRRKTPTPTPREDSPLPMSQDLAEDRGDGENSTMVKPVSKKAAKAAATDSIVENDDNKDTEKAPKAAIGSKGSAFGKKAKAVAASEPEGKEAKPKEHHSEKIKPGRKAAQEAKEKMGPNKKEHHQNQDELLKKKKKRKRKDGVANSDEDESDDEERQWVQCDKCQKWRILPSKMEASSLPEVWQCSMNSWDPKHADCAVAEQTLKQIQKERRRAKKRAKQQRLEQAALEAAGGQVESSSKHDKPPRGTKSAQNSPKPSKPVVKVGKNADLELKRASPVPSSANGSMESDSKAEKRGRKGKKDKEEAKQVETQKVVSSGEVTTPKKPGRKRGRPARNNPVEAPRNESKDDDNVEWVQCEKCEKWRKLPPYMSADELPDSWYCSLNTWNETSASCDAPEDKADAHHQEVGVFGDMPQGHVGKYSYRSMIYGTGRKYNRPMSEKARAAESLYQRPQLEEGMQQTSVMYAKSSMFVPRMSNFQKTQVVEEKRTSIFDALADSDLWAELQGVGHAMQVLSNSNLSGNQQASFLTYDSLPESIKEQMREVVLQVLGIYVLSGEELVEEALRCPWESLSGDLAQIRAFINDDIVINTLLSLVKEGEVQMTCFKDLSVPMTEWIPRYRRVVRSSPKNLETHESLKTSKCMKISKPWKQMDDSDGWITGGQ